MSARSTSRSSGAESRGKRLSPHSPDIAAQAVIAAREKWARTPEDAILRRMHLGITQNRGREAIPEVERILARNP